MSTSTLVRFVLPFLASGACLASAAQAAPTGKTVLNGSAPPWATKANLVSATDSTTDVGFRVYLGWTDPAGAAAMAAAVSDPKNAAYGHYLTPQQFRKQFAPSPASVAQVQNWLRSQGFTLTYTPKNGHFVSAEGSVAQLETAFGVSFGNYKVRGQLVRAPASDVSIPAALANIVRAEALMRRLRDLGFDVALDDFGRGLSSLTYLKTLPVTCLKIDGSFVRDVVGDDRSQAMLSAIVQLARAMGLQTVAECVESEQILDIIRGLGVEYGQGFSIGRPVPLERVIGELIQG